MKLKRGWWQRMLNFLSRQKRESHRRRSDGAKRGWEARRQREQGLPLPMDDNPLIPPKSE